MLSNLGRKTDCTQNIGKIMWSKHFLLNLRPYQSCYLEQQGNLCHFFLSFFVLCIFFLPQTLKNLFISQATGIGRKGCRLTAEDLEAYLYIFSQPGALTGPINHYRNLFRSVWRSRLKEVWFQTCFFFPLCLLSPFWGYVCWQLRASSLYFPLGKHFSTVVVLLISEASWCIIAPPTLKTFF